MRKLENTRLAIVGLAWRQRCQLRESATRLHKVRSTNSRYREADTLSPAWSGLELE